MTDLHVEQPDIHDWLVEHVRLAIAAHAKGAVDDD